MGQSSASRETEVPVTHGAARLTVVREAGDGDCLFRALARQCSGSPEFAHSIRSEICDWMDENLLPSNIAQSGRSELSEEHRGEIAKTMSDVINLYAHDEPVLTYIQRMRKSGEWGSGLEALCAAYRYKRSVSIWCDGNMDVPPVSTLVPPGSTSAASIGLLHNGSCHWDSVLTPSGWSAADDVSRAFKLFPARRETAAEAAADSAFQHEPVAAPVRIGDEERRAHREMVAARYEAKASAKPVNRPRQQFASKRQPEPCKKTAEGHAASATPSTNAAVRVERTCLPEHQHPSAENNGMAGQECIKTLVRAGLSDVEALEAWTACGGDVALVCELYGIFDSTDTAASNQEYSNTDAWTEGLNRQCVEALERVGLAEADALAAITACGGDIDKVKQMYGIDWDQTGNRTVQTWFP